jgi:hypothetical protein
MRFGSQQNIVPSGAWLAEFEVCLHDVTSLCKEVKGWEAIPTLENNKKISKSREIAYV